MIKISKEDLSNFIYDILLLRMGQNNVTVRTGNMPVTVIKLKEQGISYWRVAGHNKRMFTELVWFIINNYL